MPRPQNQAQGSYPVAQGQQYGGQNYPGYPSYPTGNQGYPGPPAQSQVYPSYPGSPTTSQGHPGYPTDQGHGYGQGQPGTQGYWGNGSPPPAGFVVQQSSQQYEAPPYTVSNEISNASSKGKNGKEEKTVLDFSEKSIRHGFIKKVYGILMCQLIFTMGIIALFMYNQATRCYVQAHTEIFWASLATLLVTIIVMACCGTLRRKAPLNYIFLAIFTLAESVLLGLTAGTFDSDVVLMAAGITLGIFFALTIFAFQTKIDFTFASAALYMLIWVVLICGIVAACIPSKAILMVYASLGVFVFCLYLIYDTQLMIGGKHEHSISPEEYIFAALSLYLDIMRIFLYILMIFGICKK